MPKKMVRILNDLINRCEDAREFYTSAARRAKNRKLKDTFRKMASTYESVIINLKEHANSLASEIEEGGTITGRASNIFKLLKARIGDTDLTLVRELEAAEDKTRADFLDALSRNPPEATRNIVERQLRILVETHDHIRNLKERLKNVA